MDEGAVIASRPGATLTSQAASGTSHKLRKRSWGAMVLAPIALVLAPSASAWVVDQQSIINFDGSKNYAKAFEIIDLPILDIAPSISFNAGLVSGGASGHANVGARFAISSSNREFDLPSKANARTFMFTATPEPTVGESFYLINQIDSLGIQKRHPVEWF